MKKILVLFFIVFPLISCKQEKKEVAGTDKNLLPWQNSNLTVDERVSDLLSRMTLDEKISQMTNASAAIDRLGIPEYDWWNECLHGVARAGKATVFPQAIGLAATWDEELIFRVASAISDEGRAKFNAAQKIGNRKRYMGISYWTPNINIFRDPRWGRGQETYGEDPYLTGRIGASLVKGLQGDDSVYLKSAACAKHYVVHSGPEKLRHEFNAVPSKKDFYETYLPAFEVLVKEAKVEAVMCAYNRTFDLPCCGSPFLLNDILRKDWGFQGHVVSDCWALEDIYQGHKTVASQEEAAAMGIKAGVNVDCGITYNALNLAVEKGLITENEIDERLSYLLRSRFKLGLFDSAEKNPYSKITEEIIHSKEHVDLAREAAVKSIVLLKNNGVLPLSKDVHDVVVTGVHGNDAQVLYGNYYGQTSDAVTIIEGITAKLNPGVRVAFRQGIMLDRDIDTLNYSIGDARQADVLIAVMGISNLMEGEENDPIATSDKGDRKDIKLPENQVKFLKTIRSKRTGPIILVVTGGSPVSLIEVEDLVDAILFVWYPGEQGGNAVADIIFGDANPSGRLPITFPKSVEQLPPFDDYNMKGRTYRYMEQEPEFTFGFGLSYTTFEYSNMKLISTEVLNGTPVDIEVDVKNTGKVDGTEVVQLYISDLQASVNVPFYALKSFKRVELKSGETKTVKFTVTPDMMTLINNDGEKILEPGEFKITVGGASPSERSVALGITKPVTGIFNLK